MPLGARSGPPRGALRRPAGDAAAGPGDRRAAADATSGANDCAGATVAAELPEWLERLRRYGDGLDDDAWGL